MAHNSSSNMAGVEQYLRDLYALVWDMGKMETPIVPLLTGRVHGSGAVIAGLSHFGISSQFATTCFPETKFGFIPNGGASFILSRLPCELGLYLALTGHKLRGTDLANLNMAHTTAEISEFLPNYLTYEVNNQTEPLPTKTLHGDVWQDLQYGMESYKAYEAVKDTYEIANRTNLTGFYRNHPENMKMTVADVLYARKVREEGYANAEGTQYKGFSGQPLQNFLENFENSFLSFIEKLPAKPLSIHHNLASIYRCFSADTLDEVFDRLVYEKANGQKMWAEEVLNTLSLKSPIALEMTFHLMKRAYEAEWSECLQNEFKAALNMAKHPDFVNGAKAMLSRKKTDVEWTSKFPISKDQVLELSSHESKLEIDSKPGQLLPVKNYWREYPHNPRFYINEISPRSIYHRRDYELEVKGFLNSLGFDIRDFNLEVPVVRSKIYLAEKTKHLIENDEIRMQRLSQDQPSIQIYTKSRIESINKFIKDSKKFKSSMRTLLEAKFKKSFEERIKTVRENSVDVHNIKKRGLIRELKDYIEEEVILQDTNNPAILRRVLGMEEMKPVPMTFPSTIHESYLPNVMNQKYDYIPKKNHFYQSKMIDIEDADNYYSMDFKKFGDKDLINEDLLKDQLAEIYSQVRILKFEDEIVAQLDSDEIEQNWNEDISLAAHKEIKDSIRASLDGEVSELNQEDKKLIEKDLPIKANKVESTDSSLNLSATQSQSLDQSDLSDIDQSLNESDSVKLPQNFFVANIEAKLSNDPEALSTLAEDVFVKTGCRDLKQGIKMLQTGNYNYDPEAMNARRRQIISQKHQIDDKFYIDEDKSTIRKLFTEHYNTPMSYEISNKMLQELELKSTKQLLSKFKEVTDERMFRENRPSEFLKSPEFIRPFDEIENDDRMPHLGKLDTTLGTRLKFEYDYLKLLFGEKSYVPVEFDNTEESSKATQELYKLCDFKESPDVWVQKSLDKCIDALFEQRKIEEMNLSTAELIAYDQDLNKNFTPEGVRRMLLSYLHNELIALQLSRETDIFEKREEDDMMVGSLKANDSSAQEYMNKNPVLRNTVEAYSFAKKFRVQSQKKYHKKLAEVNYQGDPMMRVFDFEQKIGILGKEKTHKEFITQWRGKNLMSRAELKGMADNKKNALFNMRKELELTVKIMVSVQELLKKSKFKDMDKERQIFKQILKDNQDII